GYRHGRGPMHRQRASSGRPATGDFAELRRAITELSEQIETLKAEEAPQRHREAPSEEGAETEVAELKRSIQELTEEVEELRE
ncbi:MAG: hypothetical protein ACI8U4_002023, partial [Natronomonas sp.]